MKKILTVILFIFICTIVWCDSMSTSNFLEALGSGDTTTIKKYLGNSIKVMDPYLKGNYTLTKDEAVEYLLILIESAKVLNNNGKVISFIYGKSSNIELTFENKNGKLILVKILIDEMSY